MTSTTTTCARKPGNVPILLVVVKFTMVYLWVAHPKLKGFTNRLCTNVCIELKGIHVWNRSYYKTRQLSTESITPLERSESIDLKYARYRVGLCVYTHSSAQLCVYTHCSAQLCVYTHSNAQLTNSEVKNMFTWKWVFAIVTLWRTSYACMQFPRPWDSLCWTWCYVCWALRVNLALFLDVYNPKIVIPGTFMWI
jgi:hypothetical protein